MQTGVNGRQSQAQHPLCPGPHSTAKRLRPRPLLPLLPGAGHTARPERGLSLKTLAESGGFGLTRQAGRDWVQGLLSRFGPLKDKASNAHVLDFERPLVELDNRINEVRKVAEDNGVDVSGQIQELELRAQQLRKDTYARLTATQRLQVARHANRPTFLDIALNITDKFVELHGDRAGLDDPAIVCGLGSIDGISFMLIGHQKGRNTKENIYRNFGMPQPNGYRKALRFMRHANQFGMPILTFVDTPGAFAGKSAEELGQGEAIAMNLREMFGLRVPIISIVIGEGGSGGALAIGCTNWNLIMEHSVYYVASPEACAAILWKSRAKAGAATEALKITAPDLVKAGVMDEIVSEPLGGAHSDPMGAFPYIKEAIMNIWYTKYSKMSGVEVMADRYAKFRKLGLFSEYKVKGGRLNEAREERRKLQEEGGGFHSKTGEWAATEEEAKYLDSVEARNRDWVRTLQGKNQWLNRPKVVGGKIDLDTLTGGTAFKLVGADRERYRQLARNYIRLKVARAKKRVAHVLRESGEAEARGVAVRLDALISREAEILKARVNGKPIPPPRPLPQPPAEFGQHVEARVRSMHPVRKAAVRWALAAPKTMRMKALQATLKAPLGQLLAQHRGAAAGSAASAEAGAEATGEAAATGGDGGERDSEEEQYAALQEQLGVTYKDDELAAQWYDDADVEYYMARYLGVDMSAAGGAEEGAQEPAAKAAAAGGEQAAQEQEEEEAEAQEAKAAQAPAMAVAGGNGAAKAGGDGAPVAQEAEKEVVRSQR